MFIAVDGIDGSGKTTLVRQFAELFDPLDPVTTKEPTDNSHWGQKLRTAAAQGRMARDKELEYFHQDRLHHIRTKIRPCLEVGRIVITDRYVDSTLAFQAHTPEEADELYERLIPEIIVPDVTFILKCPVRLGLSRIRKRNGGDFTQYENTSALKIAASIYESRKGKNYEIIDASNTIENVLYQAIVSLRKRFSHLHEILASEQGALCNDAEIMRVSTCD